MSGSFREAFSKTEIPVIEPGDVYKVKDKAISFPASLFRTRHPERWCVILTNNRLCAERTHRVVTIAPCSHEIKIYTDADIILRKTPGNGLVVDSRIVLSHIQTIPKDALIARTGRVSDSEWEEIMERIVWIFDRA